MSKATERYVSLVVSSMVALLVEREAYFAVSPRDDGWGGTVLRLEVFDSADLGKVIGAKGRTARVLRGFLAAVSYAQGHRYSLEIAGPEKGGAR